MNIILLLLTILLNILYLQIIFSKNSSANAAASRSFLVEKYLIILVYQSIIIRIVLYTIPRCLLDGRPVIKSIDNFYYSLLETGNDCSSL